VVVTTQRGLTDQAAVARFETVLVAGQSASISIPRRVDEAPARIVLSDAGDHLLIAKPNAAVSVR
jgi:hypothetical protein